MKVRNLYSLFALFLASLTLIVSCNNSQPSSTANVTGTETALSAVVNMGFSAWPGWIPWQIAQEENLFAANNVNVNLRWFDGYLDSINALAAGQLDANTQTLNDTISSVAAGADQVIVLTNDNSTGNDKIIVREGINSITDLRGRTIAVEEGTVDHFLLLLGLKDAGLTANDVSIQPLETGAAAAAFVAGQVDAVGVFAPFTTQALQRPGSRELFSSADYPGAIPDHLVVTRRLINERPEAVQGLVNTWFDILNYIEENRDRALEIMARRAGVSVAEYQEYDAGTTIFSLEDNLKAFSAGNNMTALPYAAEQISTFLVDSGLIQSAPDLNQLFDDRFVKAYQEKQQKS
ncbi:ABC transporter substrate-binding protein [Desertifilum sp. FACHB-1129]|uniref:Sulfonate ABC transporter substrate-binding protein n=1 Tax=Desertifilum tharense IPPAS B-1220 TaxID=1781255 RepID=A0A1E5QPI1_9CYAN|nr:MULTISPECIES: ABC transporter substrate-binding protein [Desertifilum]MDA0211026.1 ABC transporter substrate-binding protein [Cyanobacteria bacterium FC1]MBD2312720.1 ABC transporter substrate-binding protein [Desertifilum sp. FACHB-1129]MBD2320201.1 ABC transporter substrate-binding protein [Desertifilum sp. FACHB-866]MBD2330329.1 ABC transporter substrate-binding protein [Desertifilum sp. FACHB-868]OEJ76514.1 sulfonate ABC transporter substrate-binding protein [Desertifilum tharense IPPAS